MIQALKKKLMSEMPAQTETTEKSPTPEDTTTTPPVVVAPERKTSGFSKKPSLNPWTLLKIFLAQNRETVFSGVFIGISLILLATFLRQKVLIRHSPFDHVRHPHWRLSQRGKIQTTAVSPRKGGLPSGLDILAPVNLVFLIIWDSFWLHSWVWVGSRLSE